MTSVLDRYSAALAHATEAARPRVCGRVAQVRGLAATIAGLPVRVGDLVHIGADDASGRATLTAEVVAVDGADATVLPLGPITGIGVGDTVIGTGGPMTVAVGDALLGRVLDGLGRPLDGSALPPGLTRVSVEGQPPHALERQRVNRPLSLGVRAIDTMTPIGVGQRMGIFAGSGVGKSSLLSMITRGTAADVTVLALIGERGREVREFLEDDLGPEGLKNAIVIVATSDQPPMVRLRAAFVATRIAEHFRDEGRDVLLMMDSLTRLAMAQREIGLSAGEPPTTRGYPPTTFAMLPKLLERAGAGATGSITGLYTVLVEGDDHNEPIADAARSILDGHLVLDRRLAHAGHFPSIDVLQSISRVAGFVSTPEQKQVALQTRKLMAARADVKELVEIGAYAPGSNPLADEALARWPALETFLQQDMHDLTPSEHSWIVLKQVVGLG